MVSNTEQASGSVKWQSPANIALIKYWGKKENQIPANPSISFTLSNAYTEMELAWQPKTSATDSFELDFYFEKKSNSKFGQKIADFLSKHLVSFPFLKNLKLTIHSENSFPHSTGIASSASSMSALALCLCSLEEIFTGIPLSENEFFQRVSYWARLASGSASRSVYGGLVTWGKIKGIDNSDDEFASPLQLPVHDIFKNYHDSVLVVSSSEKATSSRAGHALMNQHPFRDSRYAQAHDNMAQLLTAIQNGDTETFGKITENEALTLHGLMMTSDPSVLLLQGGSIEIIKNLRTFRQQTGYPVCFTIDAGPNIHILYPEKVKNEVEAFIVSDLLQFCENNYRISDTVGEGPKKLK